MWDIVAFCAQIAGFARHESANLRDDSDVPPRQSHQPYRMPGGGRGHPQSLGETGQEGRFTDGYSFKSTSIDELWSLHEQMTSTLFRRIAGPFGLGMYFVFNQDGRK